MPTTPTRGSAPCPAVNGGGWTSRSAWSAAGPAVLDEPTVGFDLEVRREFHELVRRLSGTTILLTTHDLTEAEKVSGRIVADGTTAELAARIAGTAEVRYRLDGEEHVLSVVDSTGYVRGLLAEHGEAVDDLEVRRPGLEDVYLALVREAESELVNA